MLAIKQKISSGFEMVKTYFKCALQQTIFVQCLVRCFHRAIKVRWIIKLFCMGYENKRPIHAINAVLNLAKIAH